MKIEQMTFEIRPFEFDNTTEIILQVNVKGYFPHYQELHYKQVLHRSDFESRFEQMMKYATEAILKINDSRD